jgi:hypothetical protein
MKNTVLEKSEIWKNDLVIINELVQDGFIHATGLSSKMSGYKPELIKSELSQFKKGQLGAIGRNNSMTAAITPEGFYFLKDGTENLSKEVKEKLSYNNGNGVGVYCSNGDTILSRALFARVSNPLSEFYGDPFFGI